MTSPLYGIRDQRPALRMTLAAQGPMNLHGLEKDIDVMIEAKCKERALLRFREAMVQPPSKDAVMASKFV